ncbi:hypothetical protein SAY87_003192 [Trapa incisa]|uniref:Uncharacterized protein n=1 Tax=Trapa incisa TaxID=236973 RepID=A0AAN7KQI2_9MYRT|nr:hypothetical protein SAY87_003192 [Trapa incisa]
MDTCHDPRSYPIFPRVHVSLFQIIDATVCADVKSTWHAYRCPNSRPIKKRQLFLSLLGIQPPPTPVRRLYKLYDSPRGKYCELLDDWVLCRIYKKNSSSSSHKPLVISATAAISGKEHSYVSSSSSSSLDDMLALPPMDIDRFFAHPQMDSMKAEQQPQEEKPCLQGRLGSGGFDWATLAGISSQTQLFNYVNNDALYAPANCNLAATQVRRLAGCPVVDEEVQSGLRGGARQNLGVFHRG